MKSLLVMRHGKARDPRTAPTDFARSLTEKGIQQANDVGDALAALGYLPDAVLVSAAERTRQTADIVCNILGYGLETVDYLEDLYNAPASCWLEELERLDDLNESVFLVGHNPGVSEVISHLAGFSPYMGTADWVWMEAPVESWQELTSGICTIKHANLPV